MNEELDPEAVIHDDVVGPHGSGVLPQNGQSLERVSVNNASFRWVKDSLEPVLKDISFSASDKCLLSVVGVYV
jgi:hypothetical protein